MVLSCCSRILDLDTDMIIKAACAIMSRYASDGIVYLPGKIGKLKLFILGRRLAWPFEKLLAL
jgi:hypothetical protein